MFPNIKYLYLLSCVASAGCLLSCSSDIPASTDYGKGAEVSFAVPDQTRASITTVFDSFAVYGDMKYMGETTASPIKIFDKTEVVKTNNVWQYQGTQYWFPNHEHTFVAIHPLSVLETARHSDSKLTFSYTLPTSNDEAEDIVAATHRRLYLENDANNVTTFHFMHLLSLINFSIELIEPSTRSEESVKINKLEMSGFGTSASINIKPASRQINTQTDDSVIDIVTDKGNGLMEIYFDEPIEVINGADPVKMFGSNNAIIMLPQTFDANDKVHITLTYSANDETETTEVSSTLSSFTWDCGKSYNYRIKLELEEKEAKLVISDATIVPWNLIEDPDIVDAR